MDDGVEQFFISKSIQRAIVAKARNGYCKATLKRRVRRATISEAKMPSVMVRGFPFLLSAK